VNGSRQGKLGSLRKPIPQTERYVLSALRSERTITSAFPTTGPVPVD
jgi:hypothetical protein